MTQLVAERGRRCEYEIVLLDPTGRRIRTQPKGVPYTLGLATDKSPCTHSLSIGLANGTVDTLIPKGKPLPARGQTDRRTTVPLRAGNPEDRIRIPVVEGENPRVERNHLSGDLVIKGTDIQRDLPMGSAVEIAMTMDPSMHVKVTVYVQHLDQDFDVEFDLKTGCRDPQALRQDLDAQKARLATVAREAGPANPDAAQALDRIAREGMVAEAESLAQAATQDQDALTQLDRRLLDLAAAIDSAEDATAWPKVLAEAEETRDLLGKVIRTIDKVTAADRATHQALEAQMTQAIASRDEPQVRRCISDMDDLRIDILRREPGWWLARLEYAEQHLGDMTDPAQAQRLIAQGNRAVANNDLEGVKAAVRQLWSLFRRDGGPDPLPGGVHII
jgi:molecular chaperone DnaK (HSP70)